MFGGFDYIIAIVGGFWLLMGLIWYYFWKQSGLEFTDAYYEYQWYMWLQNNRKQR